MSDSYGPKELEREGQAKIKLMVRRASDQGRFLGHGSE